ncbi:MAG: type II toxin-antitoxin system RelE/ParE family toxin [Niabella sp.]|nr:type II toxin-antitoxin system RelE/ParE family toxin [Niabella sp.]
MGAAFYKIVWTKRAQEQLQLVYIFISKDSPQNASNIVNDIIDAVGRAEQNPAIYRPDKYKMAKDGSYRAFEKHGYRISYRFNSAIVRILRVRHTKMKPSFY